MGVHSSEVPINTIRTADLVLQAAARVLGLPVAPRVCWFRRAEVSERGKLRTRRDSGGFVERGDLGGYDKVWIKIAPANVELAKTIGHEAYHLHHSRSGRWPTTESERAILEAEAERFADEIADRIVFTADGFPIFYS